MSVSSGSISSSLWLGDGHYLRQQVFYLSRSQRDFSEQSPATSPRGKGSQGRRHCLGRGYLSPLALHGPSKAPPFHLSQSVPPTQVTLVQ